MNNSATIQPAPRRPTVAVKTLGCRLNQAETAIITGHFTAAGYSPVKFGHPCEVAIIHGCVITGRAESDSLQSVRQARRANPRALVILAGCPGETLPDPVRNDCGADLVVGQEAKLHLPGLLHRIHPDRFPPPHATGDNDPHVDTRRAYIKVQDGCDFGCAYCIVPAARGRPRSRPLPEIVGEITRLANAGFREMVLAGANLGCYASGPHTLPELLRAVTAIPSLGRIRLGSVEPGTAERAIADLLCECPKLCRFLHLPMQSGDDRILAAMGRRYDSAAYRRSVEYAAGRIPGIGLGTDVIVGFPGETDAAFQRTVRLLEDLPFSNAHVFPYSRRPGTRAADLPGQIPEKVKKERALLLRDLASRKRSEFAAGFVGRKADLLVETNDAHGFARGWTSEYLDATVHAIEAVPGDLITFTVSRSTNGALSGSAAGTGNTAKNLKHSCTSQRTSSNLFFRVG